VIAWNHRDLVIETLAADEAAALRQLAEVGAERDAFRVLLHVALEQLHLQAVTFERLRTTIVRDREVHRRLRERVLLEDGVAA
jgi:hypothetical protein|tara:strand:+ start:255 stop:503 length:249 start_codon:yes stop_codon:yes gene_type:complete